jgi:hypothetical protein
MNFAFKPASDNSLNLMPLNQPIGKACLFFRSICPAKERNGAAENSIAENHRKRASLKTQIGQGSPCPTAKAVAKRRNLTVSD